MRVARLELTGIGPFEGAVFEIPEPTTGTGELVLFEGPNGSGKTTIVQTIAVMVSGFCANVDPTILAAHPPLTGWYRRWRATALMRLLVTHEGGSLDLSAGIQGPQSEGANAVADAIHFSFRLATQVAAQPVAWAAFAYQAHQASAELTTTGPHDIEVAPLSGALSFGQHMPESKLLGQLLANLENERTKALAYANEKSDGAKKLDLERAAESRKEAIHRFESAFSKVLDRSTTIEFSLDQQAPTVFFDGAAIPLDLLGEGLRSTVAWLSDLLVRLERIRWADTVRSPIDQDFWLILDEIDESLHPTMQARIYPALRELFPNARIYATTHSPFVIASVGEGIVFPIRPGKDHMVRGKVEALTLEPGQSLEWVTTEIFQAQTGFVDQKTRDMLDEHKRDIRRFQRTGKMDWDAFFARRSELFKLNDEVRVMAAMQEVPVRREVDDRMLARAETREQREQGPAA